MSVSVIIPTLNAERYMDKLIPALLNQREAPLEIIVIDSASTDKTCALAEKYGCKVLPILREDFNHGGTRNRAARAAQGDILVFMTQDAVPQNTDFLSELTRPIREGKVVAAYARQVAASDAYPTEIFARHFNYQDCDHFKTAADISRMGIKAFFFSNVASAVRAKEFWEQGAFPESVIINEDMVLCARMLRANYSVGYHSRAVVVHSHNYRLSQQFSRYFDMGVFVARSDAEIKSARASGEGLRFVKKQLGFLWSSGRASWMPRAIGEAGAKFLGFNLGKWERLLPVGLKRRFSMHAFFWASKH
jgi:rhamnosyltransferase